MQHPGDALSCASFAGLPRLDWLAGASHAALVQLSATRAAFGNQDRHRGPDQYGSYRLIGFVMRTGFVAQEDVELPFSSPQEAQAALKVTVRSSDNRVMGLGSQPEVLLTDDRLLIKVKGWRCAA
jgi:hypothetical protein